jgi:hypothetical protein
MAPMNGKTRTIKIYDTTKERLTHYRLPTETWDDMVIRLMNYWDTGIKPEYHPHPTKHTIEIQHKDGPIEVMELDEERPGAVVIKRRDDLLWPYR